MCGRQVVKYLVRARAQVNDADKDGATALLYASRNSNMAIYKLLAKAARTDHAGMIFTENGASTDLLSQQAELDDAELERVRAMSPPRTASRSASVPLQLRDRTPGRGVSRATSRGARTPATRGSNISALPPIGSPWNERMALLDQEIERDGETMYRCSGANAAGDSSFQMAKKKIFYECYGAPPRPPTPEIVKPWVCTLCKPGHQPAFEDKAELSAHEVEAHPFECPICPNRFDTAEERRIHMRRCHKPDGFLMETALWEREKKDVPKSWRAAVERLGSEDLAVLGEIRAAIRSGLGSAKIPPAELDIPEVRPHPVAACAYVRLSRLTDASCAGSADRADPEALPSDGRGRGDHAAAARGADGGRPEQQPAVAAAEALPVGRGGSEEGADGAVAHLPGPPLPALQDQHRGQDRRYVHKPLPFLLASVPILGGTTRLTR